jgi:hypothetical protein
MGAPKLIYKDIEKFIPYFYKAVRKSNPDLFPVYSTEDLIDRYYQDPKFKDLIDLQDELRKKKYRNNQSAHGLIRGKTLNKEFYLMSDGEILKGHMSVIHYQTKNKLVCPVEKIEVESPKYKDILSKYETIRKERQDEWNRTKNTPEEIQSIRSSAGAKVANQTLYVMSNGHICKTIHTANKYVKNFKVSIIEKVTINNDLYQELHENYEFQEQEIKSLRKKYGRRSCILYILEDGTIHSVTLNKLQVNFDISKTLYTVRCDEPEYDNLREEYTRQTRQHILDNRKKEAKNKANKIINKLNKEVFTLKELKKLLIELDEKESYSTSCLKFADVELVQIAKSRHSDTIYKKVTK